MKHPTLAECEAAGRGPEPFGDKPWTEGGLPNTPEERARFEAYMRGHCWAVGNFDAPTNSYDTVHVRCLYGVWRDRGALAALPSVPECSVRSAPRDPNCKTCGQWSRPRPPK